MNRKSNLFLIIIYSLLKTTDVCLSFFGVIILGGIELNPIGFNSIIVLLIFISICFLLWCNKTITEKWFIKFVSIVMIFGIFLNLGVVIWNINSILVML